MSKQLAIMTQPKYGMRDMDEPGFWFSVSFGENLGSAALIILSPSEMGKIVKEANINSLEDLRNHPCQVETDDKGYVKFVKVLS